MIEISRAQLNFIKKHAKQEVPWEACGILIGIGDKVTSIIKAKNISNSPRYKYVIDPAFELLYNNIVGYYHSHPDGSHQASKIDQSFFNYGRLYLIYGVKDDLFGLFRNDENLVCNYEYYRLQTIK